MTEHLNKSTMKQRGNTKSDLVLIMSIPCAFYGQNQPLQRLYYFWCGYLGLMFDKKKGTECEQRTRCREKWIEAKKSRKKGITAIL